jgi:hypothetical protein
MLYRYTKLSLDFSLSVDSARSYIRKWWKKSDIFKQEQTIGWKFIFSLDETQQSNPEIKWNRFKPDKAIRLRIKWPESVSSLLIRLDFFLFGLVSNSVGDVTPTHTTSRRLLEQKHVGPA